MFGFIIVSRSGKILPPACCEVISMQAIHMWFQTTGYLSASLGASLQPPPQVKFETACYTGLFLLCDRSQLHISNCTSVALYFHEVFLRMQACTVCMCNMFLHVSVCKCTWVYTVETWTCVCRLEVHLVYIPQSSHLFFFHTVCLTESEAC